MRGADVSQPTLFITKTVEDFVPKEHPLRAIRKLVDQALSELDGKFEGLYADEGRMSIAPERLIRASLLQVLFTIRSERQLVEHIRFNMLYRWFVGLEMDDTVWHHATFSKNRERLLDEVLMTSLFKSVLKIAQRHRLLSSEHFSVDGTLIDAWASHKSFKPKEGKDDEDEGGGKERDFRNENRSNQTHVSSTDPDAELMRKGAGMEARLRYGVHHLVENRHHLIVDAKVEPAASVHEREVALTMLKKASKDRPITAGGDKGFDTRDFVQQCREHDITPHVAQNTARRGGSAIDARTTRHAGYEISQCKRKLIETTFGWSKQYGGLRRMMYRGIDKVRGQVKLVTCAFNLLRISNLVPAEEL
jgi:transposase